MGDLLLAAYEQCALKRRFAMERWSGNDALVKKMVANMVQKNSRMNIFLKRGIFNCENT